MKTAELNNKIEFNYDVIINLMLMRACSQKATLEKFAYNFQLNVNSICKQVKMINFCWVEFKFYFKNSQYHVNNV